MIVARWTSLIPLLQRKGTKRILVFFNMAHCRIQLILAFVLALGFSTKGFAEKPKCPDLYNQIPVNVSKVDSLEAGNSGQKKGPSSGYQHFDSAVKGLFDQANRAGTTVGNYLLDLVKTRGLRLILKNQDELPEFVKVYTAPKTLWQKIKSNINPFQYGFRKYTRWASGTEQTFHPIQLMDWGLVDLPTSMIFKNKSVTIPGRILMGIPAAVYIWPKVQEKIDQERHAMIRQNVEAKAEVYNKKLAFSYLYNDVYKLLDSKEFQLDPKMARLAAYNLHQGAAETSPRSLAAAVNFALTTYPSVAVEDRLGFALTHPFFSDIASLVTEGISTGGYLGTPVSQEIFVETALPKILDAKKDYLIGASTIESLAESDDKNWLQNPVLQQMLSFTDSEGKTQEDPFYVVVKKLVAKNDIDLDTARFLLEEDLWWQYEFEKRSHLGQSFARVNEKGEPTTEKLLLKDIRKESLAERQKIKDRIKRLQ